MRMRMSFGILLSPLLAQLAHFPYRYLPCLIGNSIEYPWGKTQPVWSRCDTVGWMLWGLEPLEGDTHA